MPFQSRTDGGVNSIALPRFSFISFPVNDVLLARQPASLRLCGMGNDDYANEPLRHPPPRAPGDLLTTLGGFLADAGR